MSDVIKNPNRKTEQSITVKSSKYVPEWQRLGREPIIYESNPSDVMFLGNNNKKKGQKVPSSTKPKSVQPPQQTKVSVGQNANWFDAEEKQEPILYEEVSDPPEQSSFEVSEDEENVAAEAQMEEKSEKLSPGEYGILVKDVLIAKTSSLSKAEEIIDKILFGQAEQFSDINFDDDIMLIRRIPLKIGVLAIDR